MLIPVPEHRKNYASKEYGGKSLLEIELLFTDDVLRRLNNIKEEKIVGTDITRKIFAGKKSEFWRKLFDLPKGDFKNFKPLFDKIEELFKS